jgi:tight adherence protein C
MNSSLVGGLLGALTATGIVIAVRGLPAMRPIRLQDRLAPYLSEAALASRLLGRTSATSAPFVVIRRLLGPVALSSVGLLDRLVGGAPSVRRRLRGLGRDTSVEEFRIEQVVWGGIGLLVGALLTLGVERARGGVDPVLAGVGAVIGLVTAVLARDWALTRQLARREASMLAEFPVIADLLALAVVAGEAPTDALARVCRLTSGELTRDLGIAMDRARAGMPLTKALGELAEATTLEPFARFLQGLVVAIERGTPLADVLRAQAMDVREAGKRALLEAGGKKEISMMLPVVFMILPVTVLFALYPGLLTLATLSQ